MARTAVLFGLAAQVSCAVVGVATAQSGGQTPLSVPPAPAYGRGGVALAELIAGLGNTTRVLMIGAHPDDEDTRLLTWLARGQHVEAAYLSLTRGDGGQNLIGNELGEALGVIRTEELLAARRIDGAHQYFTRAYDFGFSKTAEESYSHWPHDSLLGDVVTVVRAFRPQVIVAVFSGTPADGHGQHQVSGILARESYDVSGDTVRFPVSRYGPVWTAAKFYRDRSYFGAGDNALTINVGAYDPLLGVSYAQIAAASRSQHKSQGFGNIGPDGPVTGFVFRDATRVTGAPRAGQERSMFDGIDTTWHRFASVARDARLRAALDSIPVVLARAQSAFAAAAPGRSIAVLSQLRRLEHEVAAGRSAGGASPPTGRDAGGDAIDSDLERTVEMSERRVDRALRLASGIELRATAAHDVAAVGSGARNGATRVALTLTDRGTAGIGIIGARAFTGAVSRDVATGPTPTASRPWMVAADSAVRDTIGVGDTTVTRPWWLRTPLHGDLFTQPVSRIAEDLRPPAAAVALDLTLPANPGTDARFDAVTTVVERISDPTRGEVDRPLMFVPAISVSLDRTVEYAPANAPIDRIVRVLVRSGVDTARTVTVALEVPRGLGVDSSRRDVLLPAYGSRRVDFRVTGALPPGDVGVSATAESDGQVYRVGYTPIEYDHIRPQKLYRPAALRLRVADIKVPAGLTVAYIAGVGDNVEPMLEQLGLHVTVLDPATLPSTDLSRFTTIVVGPRAYQASPELVANNGRLLDFAKAGGTLVVQYGQYEMAGSAIMPYPITLSRPADRVTDENAPVRLTDPSSSVLTGPNAVTQADFTGWVQERSLYMPHSFDSHYHSVMSINDPGEPANDGAILVAPVGKGTYVYTTLSFFRQLPAGLPGAARLFVNLLGAGRRCCDAM